MVYQLVALDAVARDMEVALGDSCGEVAVAELENVADEAMVGVDGVEKALGAAVQKAATEAPDLVLVLLVQAGDKPVAGGFDHAVVERHLLIEKLREAEILAAGIRLLIQCGEPVGDAVKLLKLLGLDVPRRLFGRERLYHHGEIADLLVILGVKIGDIVAVVGDLCKAAVDELFKRRLDRRAADGKLLRDGIFAYPRARVQSEAYYITQQQLVNNVAQRQKGVAAANFVEFLYIHKTSS